MAQLHSFHREVNHQIRCAVIGHFTGHSSAYSRRVRELSAERRRSTKDAQTAEKLLISAERIAREILAQSSPILELEEAR